MYDDALRSPFISDIFRKKVNAYVGRNVYDLQFTIKAFTSENNTQPENLNSI